MMIVFNHKLDAFRQKYPPADAIARSINTLDKTMCLQGH